MRIGVLGAGSWGTTLSILLFSNSHQVMLWSHRASHTQEMLEQHENALLLPGVRIPDEITITSDIDHTVHNVEMLVTAVPAQFLRSALQRISSKNLQNITIINVAKGIENDSLMTMSEVIEDVLPAVKKERVATLSGPSFAEEVARKIPTAVVAASTSLSTAKLVQQTFMAPYFRVYSSEDIRGVELGGSIKNIIAIAAGVADGAGFGDNTKAAIMTRATAELGRLGTAMGAQSRTFAGLSGIGDLIVTCMSKHSRNRHVGEEIGKGRKLKEVLDEMVMVAEGVATARSVNDLAIKKNVELPLSHEVYGILFEDKHPIEATTDLMTREAKGEI